MRKLVLFISVMLSVLATYAQEDHVITDPNYRIRKSARCPKVMIDLSSGLNNNGGILGVGGDWHFWRDFSVYGGMGLISTWGFKYYGGLKLHLSPCHTGWSFGVGATYSTGMDQYTMSNVATTQGNQDVSLRLLPQTNFVFAGYRNWYVGRNRNRFFLTLGYSAPLSGKQYEQLEGAALTRTGIRAVKNKAPGGFILGLGFSLGVY